MKDIDKKAKQDIPRLREWSIKLIDIANLMLDKVKYSDDDHLGFMALCFLSKQTDHLQSILILLPRRDVILISRSMLEGLWQLLWAAKKQTILPLRWRSFAWIHDYRVLQRKIKQGDEINPEQLISIEKGLLKYGDQFMTKKAKAAKNQKKPLPPDPYNKNWRCGCQIRQICEAVGGEDLYEKIYSPFSDWHHWGVGGLGEAVKRDGNRISYSSLSDTDSATALASGFKCLWQTADLTDRYLNIDMNSKISKVYNEYIVCFSEHKKQSKHSA